MIRRKRKLAKSRKASRKIIVKLKRRYLYRELNISILNNKSQSSKMLALKSIKSMQPKLNFPNIEKLEKSIQILKEADLSKVSFQKVIFSLRKGIGLIPVTIAKLQAGYPIFRARINKNGEIFSSEKEISYRTDFENISKYGRANVPHQSMFYGAFESSEVEYPRIVNLFELSELFRNPNNADGVEIMTVGKWRIKKEFLVVEMVFSKGNVQNNQDIKKSYEYQKGLMIKDHPDQIEQIEKVLEFFSDEFAKANIKNDADYKISAAYSYMVLNQRNDIHGVTYPSVRTDYKANNIALFPESVEQFLELENVGMFKITKKGKNSFMDNLAIATELGNLNSGFKWTDLQGKTDEEIENIIIAGVPG